MKSILIKAFALLTVMAVLLTGCAATPEATEAPTEAPATEAPAASEEPAASEAPAASEEPAASTLSGELMITGSTSAEPLVTVFGDLFMEANPDVSVAVQGNGSSAGITAATNGTAQLGMSSRNLSEEEAAAEGVTGTTICMDGIAVVVNLENPVKDLTTDQIASIFKGEITNWKEVGGADLEIACIGREAGSGTRDGFESITKTEDACKLSQELTSTGAVIEAVKNSENAIGYASLSAAEGQDGIKLLTVGGVTCSEETVKDGSYEIQRPFNLVTKDGEALSPAAQAFFDYATSADAAELIRAAGAVPVA